MGIVALVIYLDDKGAPIFSQARLTKDGKVFYMHKFRSMCVDAEQKFAEVQKEKRNRRSGVQERERPANHTDRAFYPENVH